MVAQRCKTHYCNKSENKTTKFKKIEHFREHIYKTENTTTLF